VLLVGLREKGLEGALRCCALCTLAGGLRDLRDVPPGAGNTSHCFNDYNHCDCTTMLGEVSDSTNDGQVAGIARGNLLGPGIRTASDETLGPGGSWCTCTNGAGQEPPADVAHLQVQNYNST
jgi:hypothetical protein